MKRFLPPEPIDHGLMHDNCGNPVVFMRPCVLDDLVSELENGGAEFVLSALMEMQMDAVKGIEMLKSL